MVEQEESAQLSETAWAVESHRRLLSAAAEAAVAAVAHTLQIFLPHLEERVWPMGRPGNPWSDRQIYERVMNK